MSQPAPADGRSPSGPLTGLRVLDLGRYIAGPLAGVFLADQGADVVRVVRRGEPCWDEHTQAALARSKRTLVADLHTPAGRAAVDELATTADVVIENFRPGVLDRLGFGYDRLRRANPGIVVVSMPAYSRHDPRASEIAWDSTISAATGLFTDLSVAGAAVGLPPTYTSLPLPSVYAGLWGAIGAVAAVYGRRSTGLGDHVEVPLLDAALSAAAGVIFQTRNQPARYNAPPINRSVLDAVNLRHLPDRAALAAHRLAEQAMPPFFANYRCGDDKLLFLCAIDNASQITKLLEATALTQTALDLGFIDGDVLDLDVTDTNLNAYRGTSRRWRHLRKHLAAAFSTAPADTWAERLARAGVPAVTQRSTADWATSQVMHDSGVLVTDTGGVVRPAPQVDVSGTNVHTEAPSERSIIELAAGIGWLHPPTFITTTGWHGRHGQHDQHGPEDQRMPDAAQTPNSTTAGRLPLSGVRVLDLANVIAGPAAGRTLAELGADVTHVSAVTPRMGPRMTLLLGLEVNRGKRSLACDLHTPDGRALLTQLVPGSDVVLYNKLPDQAERLGVSPSRVHSINDRAVVTAVTAFSGTQPGGWEDRPAYDPVIQALTGIMQRFGGPDTPAVHGIASCIDYFTGFAAAFGTIVGLLAREQGARSITTRTSLVRTAAWVQVNQLGRHAEPTTAGLLERGPRTLDRIYRTRDAWVHIGPPAPSTSRSTSPPTHPSTAGTPEPLLTLDYLARAMRSRRTDVAIAWARKQGLTAVRVRSAAELRDSAGLGGADSSTPASGRIGLVDHPAGESMWIPDATWLRFASTPHRNIVPAPAPGADTADIVGELGRGDDLASLLERNVVSTGWTTGPTYLPR